MASATQIVRQTTAQVVSAIALIELPKGQWNELIPNLTSAVTTSPDDGLKEAVLETIGFICEEIVRPTRQPQPPRCDGARQSASLVAACSLWALGVRGWWSLEGDESGVRGGLSAPAWGLSVVMGACAHTSSRPVPQDPEALTAHSNAILTAVVQGMRADMPSGAANSFQVRLKATQAMYNTMEFVKQNFENEAERNYIMQTLCETTQVDNKDIQLAAYEAIVRVAELYYDKLPPYMEALFGLTTGLIGKATTQHSEDLDELGRQAIEFWTSICDEELELIESAREQGTAPQLHRFVQGAVGVLMPLLLEALCLQDPDEDPEDDNWNMAQASALCITKIAMTIEDAVVPLVMPFMQKHIVDPDWKRREAATLAFGSILEGPSSESLGAIVAQGLDVLIKHMGDPQLQVKDTAAWAIGRVYEHHIRSITPTQLQLMFRPLAPGEPAENEGVLLRGLKDDSRVANNVCVALHNLAEQCEEQKDLSTNPLSPLVRTAPRPTTPPHHRTTTKVHATRPIRVRTNAAQPRPLIGPCACDLCRPRGPHEHMITMNA